MRRCYTAVGCSLVPRPRGQEERRTVVERIVEHIAKTTCGKGTRVLFVGEEVGRMVKVDKTTMGVKEILDIKDRLEKEVRKVGETLPLSIETFSGTGEACRGTEVWIPQRGEGRMKGGEKESGSVSHRPIEVLLRFEGSSKWPTEVRALQEAQMAFLIKIAEGMGGSIVGEGWEGGVVVEREGVTWKIGVEREKEIKILRGISNRTKEEEEALKWLELKGGKKKTAHHTFVHGLGTAHRTYGDCVRLLKKWVQANMMGNLVTGEILELVAANVYEESGGKEPPSCLAMGFQLCLKLLAEFPFETQPLVVDPRGHLSKVTGGAKRRQLE